MVGDGMLGEHNVDGKAGKYGCGSGGHDIHECE